MDFNKEYSEKFDELRKNRIRVSFHKYGSVADNYGKGFVQAIPTLEKCLDKYKATGNTEYLCDLANYAMFEFMYPQHPKGTFLRNRRQGKCRDCWAKCERGEGY